MKALLSYQELQNIIAEKAKQPLSFSQTDEKTLCVSYVLDLGIFKKTLNANLKVEEIRGSDITVSYANDKAMQMVIDMALKMLRDKIPADVLEEAQGSRLIIHLSKIEQVEKVLANFTLNDISMRDNGIEIDGTLKS